MGYPTALWDQNLQDTANDPVVADDTVAEARDYNEMAAEVAAIQTELGYGATTATDNPKGSAASLTARLAVSLTATGALKANTVTRGNLAQGTALSLMGVAGNAAADVADIAAASDHQVMRRSGTAIAFGSINLAQSAAVTGILGTANGGTGIAFFTAAGPTVARVYTFPDAACTILTTNAAVTVAQGGTGVATFTSGGVVYGQGASALLVTAAPTSGQILIGDTTVPSFKTMSGDVTILNTGVTAIGASKVLTSMIANSNVTDAKVAATVPQLGKNKIINGAMNIWQRGTSLAGITSGSIVADRFMYVKAATAAIHTVARSTTVPTFANAGYLFYYSYNALITTADTSLANGDVALIRTIIEGFVWRGLAQRSFTLSFWAKSAISGVMSVSFQNSDQTISYIKEVTIPDTGWNKYTVTVPASPSAGTWDYISGTGIKVQWCLISGADFYGTIDAWTTQTNKHAGSNQTNLCNTGGDFYLTGVQLEVGSVVTDFEYIDYALEKLRCQRYYSKSYIDGVKAGTGSSSGYVTFIGSDGSNYATCSVQFPVPMRTSPVITLYSWAGTVAKVHSFVSAADFGTTVTASSGSQLGFAYITDSGAAFVKGNHYGGYWEADAELS